MTIAVTNIPSHFRMGEPYLRACKYVKLALGMHPLAVAANYSELADFVSMVHGVDYVGEVGLDFSKAGIATKEKQTTAFRAIVKTLSDRARFITLHSRGAERLVVEILDEFAISDAIFHWYTGPLDVLDDAISKGFYFSVNPAMRNTEKGRAIIARIPKLQVLTESDGPYARVHNRPAEPPDVLLVIEYLAKIWNQSASEVSQQVFDNYTRIAGRVSAQRDG